MQFRVLQSVWMQRCEKLIGFSGSVALAQMATGIDGLPRIAGTLELGDTEIRFEPVMCGKCAFQTIPSFHADQPGGIRTFKPCVGFQLFENPPQLRAILFFYWRCDAIFSENRLLFLLCDVFGAVQIGDALRFSLCQQRGLFRLGLKTKLSFSLKLFQLQSSCLFSSALGLGFCFSNQCDTAFPFGCGSLLVLRPGNIAFDKACKCMQFIAVQVSDVIFGAGFVFRACFEDFVKMRADFNGHIQIVNQISSCQFK